MLDNMMRCSFWRKTSTSLKILVGIFLCILFYYEWLSYQLLPLFWPSTGILETLYPSLRVHDEGDLSATRNRVLRVLLVADPQIQGIRNEPKGFLGMVTRWDIDRYLTKTYTRAFYHTNPHLVVFLGDLLDEGSIASEEEFVEYAGRFHKIFFLESAAVMYIPGDNDIGGEGEPVTVENVNRFRKYFRSKSSEPWSSILCLSELNSLTKFMNSNVTVCKDRTIPRILLSHFPYFSENVYAPFDKIMSELSPTLGISAHTHKASIAQKPFSSSALSHVSSTHRSDFSVFDLHAKPVNMQEIVVPTCSYRMGVPEMGYGMAVIDLSRSRLFYSVLWLPPRYPHLFTELYATVIFFVLALAFLVRYVCCLRSQRKVRFSV